MSMMDVMSTEEMVSLLEPGSSPARKKQPSQETEAKKPPDDCQTETVEEEFNPVAAAIKRSNAKLVLEDSSDNDEGMESPSKSASPEKENAPSKDDESDSDNEDVVTASSKKKKNRRAILEDSSDSDEAAASKPKSDSEDANSGSDDDEVSIKPKKKLTKRRGAFANSSSDESSDDDDSSAKKKAKAKTNESSDSEGPLDTSVHHRVHSSSDESAQSEDDLAKIKAGFYGKDAGKTKSKKRETRNPSSAESEDDLGKIKGNAGKPKEKKREKQQSRKSRDDAMREIRSESSRMLREAAVGLPYHAPKQRTLDEFLNRHKAASVLQSYVCKDFKTITREQVELEKAEELLKKCEQETEEFFAAAPEEDDDDDEDEDYVPMEADTAAAADASQPSCDSSSQAVIKAVDDSGIATSALEGDGSASNEAQQQSEQQLPAATEQPPATPTKEEVPRQEPEPESLKLFLEPDTEKLVLSDDDDDEEAKSADSEVVESSQSAETTETPGGGGGIKSKHDVSTKLANLASLGDDILNLTPKLGKNPGGDDLIVFDEEAAPSGNKGIDLLKERFVKHVRCDKKAAAEAKKRAETTLTIVSKERDSVTGQETLRTEKLNYVPSQGSPSIAKMDFEKVRQAKKSERIGAQVLALKATLKEKIAEKKRQEKQKNSERKKLDEEEESEEESDKEPMEDDDEEILDDEDITDEEDSEEEEELEEDTAATKERRRIKASCSFLNDEAEDDDDNEDDEDDELILTKDDKDDDGIGAVVSAVLGIDEDAVPAAVEELEEPRPQDIEAAVEDVSASPFSSLLEPRWTPYSQQTQQRLKAAAGKTGGGSAKKKLGFDDLFDVSDPQVDDMDDVVGLLSGQFATQARPAKPTQEDEDDDEASFGRAGLSQDSTQDTVLNSQACATPDTQVLTNKPTQDEPSGTPDTQPLTNVDDGRGTPDTQPLTHQPTPDTLPLTAAEGVTQPQQTTDSNREAPGFMEEDCGFLMLSSSDEDDEAAAAKKKVLSKKKKAKKLVLSDDSDSEGEAEKEEKQVSETEEVEEGKSENEEDKVVMYDSDENAITMAEYKQKFKGFKNKKGKIRGLFVDEEAALSGSDDELARYSDDEDERGLDRFEREAGDADDLDEDDVRDELERIHHREVLNQDQREIKYIQEVMLDDGDLHSDNARTRKFRWNNLDDDIELERRPSDDEAENEDAATLQAEQEKRRLERMEREKWLKEAEEKGDKDAATKADDEDDSQFFSMAQKAMKKMGSKSSSMPTKKPSSVVSPSKSRLFPLRPMTSNQKGSFLGREAATLERLAEMTKGVDNQRSGTGAKKNTKNFVFTTLSPTKADQGGGDESPSASAAKRKKTTPVANPAAAKKAKVARSIDENSCDTIFGKLSWS